MTITLLKLLRRFAGVETGSECRGCGDAIRRSDPFGRSEGFCRACRSTGA